MSVKPPELAFLNGLSHEQIVYAVKVAQAAEKAGVPPKLAVAIAYQESGLNPNAPNGTAGEIGLMQIKPNTAKGKGFSLSDIKTPQGNIDAGIAYLKESWELNKKNPKLTAYGYNRGIDDPMFYGGEANPLGQDYVKAIAKHGAFNGLVNETDANTEAPASTASEAPADDTEAKSERSTVVAASPPSPKPPDTSGASKGERFVTGSVGTAIGASVPLGKGIFKAKDARDIRKAGEIAKAQEEARLSVQSANGSAKAGNVPAQLKQITPLQKIDPTLTNAVEGDAQSARILRGGEGSTLGTSGRARQEGYSIETAQRAASKDAAQELSEFMKKSGMTETDARRYLAGQPGLTSTEHGVLYPRSEPRPTIGARTFEPAPIQVQAAQSGGLPVGSGEVYKIGGANPPPPPPAPPAPPSLAQRTAAGLDEVANLFKSMMKPVAATAKYASKYALPPLAGLSAGLDVAEMAHEYDKPAEQRDYIKMGTKGVGALGGALSMFPPTATVGVPLMLGAGAVDAYRDPEKRAYIEKMMEDAQRGVMRNVGVPFEFGPAQ
jgi:hypothetical protein